MVAITPVYQAEERDWSTGKYLLTPPFRLQGFGSLKLYHRIAPQRSAGLIGLDRVKQFEAYPSGIPCFPIRPPLPERLKNHGREKKKSITWHQQVTLSSQSGLD
jgi:hypothetical protein